MTTEAATILDRLFEAALGAALGDRVADHLPPPVSGRTVVVGAGKASAAMARAFDRAWPGPLSGLVVVPDGHAVACRRIEIVEAAHPTPDERGYRAATRILALARSLGEDDQLVCLISGGGSALLSLPMPPVTLADKQVVNDALLASGATIAEINIVRRHLSAIKGGRLAVAAWPARVVTLAISDVPGDDPAAIASGPTVGDRSTCADALAVLRRHAIRAPDRVAAMLSTQQSETLKPGDPRLSRSAFAIVATPRMALDAAAAAAGGMGLRAHVLGDAIEGESRTVAVGMADIVRAIVRGDGPAASPCVLLSGGETTVTVRGAGRGGRNVEFLLALALSLDGMPGVCALAADTDGIDGREPVAGARIDPTTLARARAAGLDPAGMLEDNDAHGFFEALGDQVITGPTLTNVNDFRAILISREPA